jgi:hypothetical protein
MVAWAATRSDPATHITALVALVHAHLVLPANRTATRWIKTPLAESFLVFVTEFKRLITLHAIKCLVVHCFSSDRFGSLLRFGYRFGHPTLRYQAAAWQLIYALLAMKVPIGLVLIMLTKAKSKKWKHEWISKCNFLRIWRIK